MERLANQLGGKQFRKPDEKVAKPVKMFMILRGKAAGKAEAGEESSEAEEEPRPVKAPFRRTRMDSNKKIMNMQKNLMRMYNQMIPTMSEDQMMEILPKQMSPKVDQMIEGEETRIRERLLKNDSETEVERKLFQDDDQDEEEKRAKVLYEERLEKLTQAEKKMKR